MSMKAKKVFFYGLIMMLLNFQGIVGTKLSWNKKTYAASSYEEKYQAFINDDRWKNGIGWGGSQGPKLSGWSSSGCCAYCADFEKYVYGTQGWSGSAFYSVADIKAGDILHVSPEHWFVVLNRNGNNLYTAEGNCSSKVIISNSRYTISGNSISYTSGSGPASFSLVVGYHYDTGTVSGTTPTPVETWSNKTESVSETNAVLGITYNAGSSKYFGYIGLYVNGSYACGYDPGYTGSSYSFSFDLNKDAGMTLQPGQTYKYQLYVNTMDGSDIFSPEYSFTTTSSSGNTNPVTPSGGNVGNMDIVNYACQFEGKPYVWGTHGPDTFDCSGFVYYVFQHFGRSLSLSSADYWNSPTNYGTVVSEGDALPGDVVSWSGHVGIYIGDGYMINALNANAGVCKTKITSYIDSDGNSNPAHKYIRINGVSTGHTHSYTATVTKQPTCTETGIKTFTCSCGDSYTEAIPAKGHQYQDTVIAPTMTENGSIIYTCSGCGDVKQDIIPLPTLKEDGWYYCKLMPTGINTAEYEVQYNNYFEKEQKDSPGEGWTKAETVKNEWVNSGETYQSEAELPTSDARILVKSVYYHFCGPNAGDVGNYEMTGNYVHYDEIVIGQYGVNVDSQGDDEGHTYYLLSWADGGGRVKCASGVTCDGSYGTHGERCQVWYKMNTYQDRVKEEIYKYTKTSGWEKDKDNSAASAEVRFKKSETGEPSVPGDLNADGTINSTDVILLRRYIAGGYGVSINEKAADVNDDGKINSSDVILIRRFIAGGYGVELK